jgi:hypothetical protein
VPSWYGTRPAPSSTQERISSRSQWSATSSQRHSAGATGFGHICLETVME